MPSHRKFIRTLSLPLTLLIILISLMGLSNPNVYSRETPNWYAQAVAQDGFDLFTLTPVLIITAYLADRNRTAFLVWGGTLLYCIYTFVIYCFAVHFNMLFPLYCFALGLSVFAFVYFLGRVIAQPLIAQVRNNYALKSAAFFLIAISVFFYIAWLSVIIPAAIRNAPPDVLAETGLPANPVHALDLSVYLPGLFIVGILALREKPLGLTFIPVALTFSVLMNLTIGTITVVMRMNDIPTSLFLPVAMLVLAFVSTWLLVWYLKSIGTGKNE